VKCQSDFNAIALLNTPGRLALYNNLITKVSEPSAEYGDTAKDDILTLTLKIDETIQQIKPDGWRGVQAREQVIKAALYGVLQDVPEVERIFLIIYQQSEY